MRSCVALLLACAKPFCALVLEAPCCSEKVHIPADFGARHALQQHELLLASPLDLCSPINRQLNATGKFLLALRGKCRFLTKAYLAQRANASGLIVMDDVDRDAWEVRMHSDDHDATQDIAIPAVFVSHATGRELAAHVRASAVVVSLNGTGEVYTITQFLERWDLSAEHVRLVHAALEFGQAMLPYMGYVYAISFAYVLVSSLYALLLNWSVAVARRIFLHGPWRHLNVVSYSQHLDLMMATSGEAASCAICLDQFGPCDQIKLLPCTHIYHRSCIDKWFEKGSNACPLCKRPAFP